jgi:hypothetical protein
MALVVEKRAMSSTNVRKNKLISSLGGGIYSLALIILKRLLHGNVGKDSIYAAIGVLIY